MTQSPNPAQAGGISITPQDAEDALLVEAYGDGGFKLQGRRVKGALYVNGQGFWPVQAETLADLSLDQIGDQLASNKPELILIGTGARMSLAPKDLRLAFEQAGVSYDVMDTGAAARTYNVLLLEGRQVGALLLPV